MYFFYLGKLPPPPPYPGTSPATVEATPSKLAMPTNGKVALINVGVSSVNASAGGSVITTSYITNGNNQSAKEIVQGLTPRKLVINNNIPASNNKRNNTIRKLPISSTTITEDMVLDVTATNRLIEGNGSSGKSIIINTNDSLAQSNNNKLLSSGGNSNNISSVKYLLPLSPVQITSSGNVEKNV